MPLVYNKLLVFSCQVFDVSQFLGLEPDRRPQNNFALDLEHSLAATFAHMDMDRPVFVAVEEETEAVLRACLKNRSSRRNEALISSATGDPQRNFRPPIYGREQKRREAPHSKRFALLQ